MRNPSQSIRRIVMPLLVAGGCSSAHSQEPPVEAVSEVIQRHKDRYREMSEAIEPGSSKPRGQRSNERPAARAGQAPAVGEPPATQRDPFAQTPLMLQGGGALAGGNAGGGSLPALRLRGLVRRDGAGSIALIEIDGVGTLALRAGEVVTVRANQQPLTLQLKRILSSSVEIEAGQSLQIVVR